MSGTARIPEEDLQFEFMRATGPGGQNVNKVSTAVRLRFDLAGTRALTPAVKARLAALAGHRLGADGALRIQARNHRTQEGNRRDALARLAELIARASIEPKARRATRPTASSRQRRLEGKTRRKRLKQLRGAVGSD
jgi:ribosome-associated protein